VPTPAQRKNDNFSESYADMRSMQSFASMNGFQILGSESQLLGHYSAGEIRFLSA
jgi:hypothetical protein